MSAASSTSKTTIRDLIAARAAGESRAMLTCYDATTAGLLAEAGLNHVLVGDSAANVILGHDTTVPIRQEFLVELCRAVRRGHPTCNLVLDSAFGGHFGDAGAERLVETFKASRADALKIEVTPELVPLVRRLSGVGVPVIAHVGLTPQHVLTTGGYRYRGRTAKAARELAFLAKDLEDAGAVAFLLEATTPAATRHLLGEVGRPVIGCGAGPGCAAYVIVLHDLLGLSPHRAKFVPDVERHAEGTVRDAMLASMRSWHALVASGRYPMPHHCYEMPDKQRRLLLGLGADDELPDDFDRSHDDPEAREVLA